MATVAQRLGQAPLVIRLRPHIELTSDQFFEFCQLNGDLRIERTAEGEVLIMAPAGGGSAYRELMLARQLSEWAEQDGAGVAFGPSVGFELPNVATRSPDASWVRKERLKTLPSERKEKFLPLCPDFAAEMLSPSDSLRTAKDKMQEYIDNGARLAWLIDPSERRIYIYRPGAEVELLENRDTVSGDPELPGFVLELRSIWELPF